MLEAGFRDPHTGGNDFGGPVQPVCGRGKKAVCMDIAGYSGLSDVFSRILFYAGAVYLAFTSAVTVCALTMHAGGYGILRFFGLIFPQGIFYALAAYLLWIVVREPVRGNEQSRILSMILLTALGIAAETLINPEVSAGVFRFFS